MDSVSEADGQTAGGYPTMTSLRTTREGMEEDEYDFGVHWRDQGERTGTRLSVHP